MGGVLCPWVAQRRRRSFPWLFRRLGKAPKSSNRGGNLARGFVPAASSLPLQSLLTRHHHPLNQSLESILKSQKLAMKILKDRDDLLEVPLPVCLPWPFVSTSHRSEMSQCLSTRAFHQTIPSRDDDIEIHMFNLLLIPVWTSKRAIII